MKKKIAIITNQPISSGVGRYAFMIFEQLKSFNVDLYFINRKQCVLCVYNNYGNNIVYKFNKHAILDKIYNPLLKNLFLDYVLCKKVPNNYDVYHLSNQNLSFCAFLIKNKKIVITVHDIVYLSHPISSAQKIAGRFLYKGIKKSDFIITISNSAKKDLCSYYPELDEEKIEIIYHGIKNNFRPLPYDDYKYMYKKYDLDREAKYIMHIGGSSPRKNISFLLDSFKYLRENYKINDIKLLKINNIEKSLIENMDGCIKVIDFVEEDDLPKMYNLSNIVVLPSLYEGFGFPLIEAMACGIPVIGSNVSSIPEIIGNAGITIDPCNVKDFADAMYHLLNDQVLTSKLKIKGMERAKNFTWKSAALKHMEVYKRV
jgi:glycosyltransferase involved in cell wall biosynthesis